MGEQVCVMTIVIFVVNSVRIRFLRSVLGFTYICVSVLYPAGSLDTVQQFVECEIQGLSKSNDQTKRF